MIEVRVATAKDIDVWVKLRLKLWPHPSVEEHQKEVPEELANPERECFLAFDGDKAIGFAELSLRSVVDGCYSSPVAYLEGLYVEPEYQGQGVGRKLVESGGQWGLTKGCSEMGSDAEVENQRSIDVHLKLGFEEVDRVVQFKKDLNNGV